MIADWEVKLIPFEHRRFGGSQLSSEPICNLSHFIQLHFNFVLALSTESSNAWQAQSTSLPQAGARSE